MKKLLLSVLLFFGLSLGINSQQTIGLFLNDSLSQNGYTLWTTGLNTYLIDNCGYLINRWEHSTRPGLSVYLLENGNLLRTGKIQGTINGAGSGGRIEEYDWDGNIVWSFDISSPLLQQHHDIEPLPNGNVLVISWVLKTAEEAEAAGAANAITYWSESIFELKKIGVNEASIAWEWHLWDHLVQDHDPTKENYGVVSERPELMNINFEPPSGGGGGPGGGADWMHFNGIDYDPLRDEIIISARSVDEIYIIDHSTTTEEAAGHSGGNKGKGGDFLYRWGNPEAYGMGDIDDRKLYGQHDAKVIPEGYPNAGSITLFNNGRGRPDATYSTVDMITPDRDADGNYVLPPSGVYGPDELTWEYRANPPGDFYSSNMAGAHSLPNGNVIICEANTGRFFEVNRDNQIVWHYQNAAGNNGPLTQGTIVGMGSSAFRVTRYLPDYPAFDGKDLTPGDPIELNPISYDCTIYDGIISDISSPEALENVSITNNIYEQSVKIENHSTETLMVQLFDLTGQKMDVFRCIPGEMIIDISGYPAGMYACLITDEGLSKSLTRKVVRW